MNSVPIVSPEAPITTDRAASAPPAGRRLEADDAAVTRHFVALDSLRGIAALMVALYHFHARGPLDGAAVLRNAWLFVDFFFVLSGFVIAANYRERLAQGFGVLRFMVLRFGRLYPLHLVMLAAFVATEALLALAGAGLGGSGRTPFTGQTAPEAIVTNLLLVQKIGFHTGLTWNGVAWSVSTEFWTYIVYAAAVALAGPRRLLPLLAMLLAGAAIVGLYLAWPGEWLRFVDLGRCIQGFATGALVHHLFARGVLRMPEASITPALATVAEVAAASLAVAFVINAATLPVHILTPLAFAPAVLVFALDRGWISRLLAIRPLVYLGLLSYSIYLTHPFVQSRIMLPVAVMLQRHLPVELVTMATVDGTSTPVWGTGYWQGAAATAVMLLLVVAASATAYRLVEAPGRAVARAFARTLDPALVRTRAA